MVQTRDTSWDVLGNARVQPAGPDPLGGPTGRWIVAGGEARPNGAQRNPRYPAPQTTQAPAGRWNRRTSRAPLAANDNLSSPAPDTYLYALQDLPGRQAGANHNVLGLIEPDGDLLHRFDYTPGVYPACGSRRRNYCTGADDTTAMACVFFVNVAISDIPQPYGLCDAGHQGLLNDKETGLIYNRARFTDPRLGRFLQRDPSGYVDGMSLYQYAVSAPLVWLDPLGLFDLYYHEQLTRKAFEGLGIHKDVLDAIVVYNFEADVLGVYYDASASNVGRTKEILAKAREGIAELLGGGNKTGLAGDRTLDAMLRPYYHGLHLDDLPESLSGQMSHHIDNFLYNCKGDADRLGGHMHAIQDFSAHSNWAEIQAKNNKDFDPTAIPTWYDIVGRERNSTKGADSIGGLRSGWYYQADKHKNEPQFHHDRMNKDHEGRPFFTQAYSAAERTSREVAQHLVEIVKRENPEVWKLLQKPLDPSKRLTIRRKYSAYKYLADSLGHWRYEHPKEKK